ncbi:hypothetical protein [Coxiella burnetii]|uniref:hypothetical protein n=1 Tax=Coxiella burnetii TaxID=777 RepID=UPI000592BBD8|nr:hypothetical protein [Coxiella burnetii]
MYSPAWPHSEVKEIFPNIFFVTGTNITHHDNTELQHSRNMIIIRDNGKLSLINTVRLNDKELAFLDALGEVNWLAPDTFFSTETATLYQEQGFFGAASISTVWKQACNVSSSDFERLKTLKFRHLLSAHGEPLLNNAYELVAKTIRKEYGI